MSDDLFSRDEVLGGLPAGRAHTLLFLIESRTAHLVARTRRAMDLAATEQTTQQRDLAFLEAFSLGREPPLRPSIQDLERHATAWESLVPANPRLRAALAHALAEKYRFTRSSVPHIRAVLGLDSSPVQQAFQRAYHDRLESLYATRLDPLQRARWIFAGLSHWLETRPPFWTAYSLSLTETIGGGILALPLALAGLGPIPGVIVLVLIGLVSTTTLAAQAEAIVRSGPVRYGDVFFGRIVTGYLGPLAALIPTFALAMYAALVLVAFYVGVATTLSAAIPLPPAITVALLFLAGVYLVSRDSLSATVTSALLIGATNITLILVLSLIALLHFQPANLAHENVPFIAGHPFQSSILALIFGVLLAAYFGHLSVANCGRIVLQRDPSGRSLLWGAIGAQLTAMTLYCLWVIAIGAAIPYRVLERVTGTSIVPLAHVAGPSVVVLGSIYAVLAMAMGSVHFVLALRNLTRDWLPGRAHVVLLLPRQHGRLLFENLSLAYLGLRDSRPAFRLTGEVEGSPRHVDIVVDGHCDLEREARRGRLEAPGIAFTVVDVENEFARLRISAPRAPAYRGDWISAGAPVGEILALDETERGLLQWIMRRGPSSLQEIVAGVPGDRARIASLLDALVAQGMVAETAQNGETRYRAHLARAGGRAVPDRVWRALGLEASSPGQEGRPAQGPSKATSARQRPAVGLAFRLRLQRLVRSQHGRDLIAMLPGGIVFLLTEYFLVRGRASFAAPLAFGGVVCVSVLGGVYPMLLLVASRRKGERVPGTVWRRLGYPEVVAALYLLFVVILLLHGLFIWEIGIERAGAVLITLALLVLTAIIARHGAFARRLVIELRTGVTGNGGYSVVDAGDPRAVSVGLEYSDDQEQMEAAGGPIPRFESLRRASFVLPAGAASQLEVWVHRVTPGEESEQIPATVEIRGDITSRYDLALSDGRLITRLADRPHSLRIELMQPSPRTSAPAGIDWRQERKSAIDGE